MRYLQPPKESPKAPTPPPSEVEVDQPEIEKPKGSGFFSSFFNPIGEFLKPQDNKPEENIPGDNKAEDIKPEDIKPPIDNKPLVIKPQGDKPRDNKPQEVKEAPPSGGFLDNLFTDLLVAWSGPSLATDDSVDHDNHTALLSANLKESKYNMLVKHKAEVFLGLFRLTRKDEKPIIDWIHEAVKIWKQVIGVGVGKVEVLDENGNSKEILISLLRTGIVL